jgi:hypothetical protein
MRRNVRCLNRELGNVNRGSSGYNLPNGSTAGSVYGRNMSTKMNSETDAVGDDAYYDNDDDDGKSSDVDDKQEGGIPAKSDVNDNLFYFQPAKTGVSGEWLMNQVAMYEYYSVQVCQEDISMNYTIQEGRRNVIAIATRPSHNSFSSAATATGITNATTNSFDTNSAINVARLFNTSTSMSERTLLMYTAAEGTDSRGDRAPISPRPFRSSQPS